MRREISQIIKEWKDEAGVKGIILVGAYPNIGHIIKICTDKPGWMVGEGGRLINKYTEKLKEICPSLQNIEFVETDRWYIR